MVSRALGVALAALLAAGAAEARQHHPARGHRIVAAGAAPLDSFATPSGAYSFRKLKSTYSGNAVRIRRASDNAEVDIGFLGCTGFTGCPWDEAAANAHCAATTCFGRAWYDQSGLVRDLVQTTAANQLQLVFNCNGSLPCFRETAVTQLLATASTFAPAGTETLSVVVQRTGGTGSCAIRQNGAVNRITAGNGFANIWALGGSAGSINSAATVMDGVWHSMTGAINGASSVFNVDGGEVTGSITGGTVAGGYQLLGPGAPTVCNFAEYILWDAYALTPAERVVLQGNQKSFWGTP